MHPPRWMERARKMPFYDSGSIPASIFPPGIGYPQRQALDTEKRKGGGGMQLPACELAGKKRKKRAMISFGEYPFSFLSANEPPFFSSHMRIRRKETISHPFQKKSRADLATLVLSLLIAGNIAGEITMYSRGTFTRHEKSPLYLSPKWAPPPPPPGGKLQKGYKPRVVDEKKKKKNKN